MKTKAPLALIELIIMAAVFALCAALCLQAFSSADGISREGRELSRAATAAQNAAETVKGTGGDLALASDVLGGTVSHGVWEICYDDGWETLPAGQTGDYVTRVQPEPAEIPGLGRAQVRVMRGNETLFEITAAWQEGVGNG